MIPSGNTSSSIPATNSGESIFSSVAAGVAATVGRSAAPEATYKTVSRHQGQGALLSFKRMRQERHALWVVVAMAILVC